MSKFDEHQNDSINNTPIILWNHRWEYDKNPEDFFDCLKKLKKQNIKFKLIILGEEFQTEMNTFTKARDYFSNEIIHMGYSTPFEEYARLLHKSDILPVTTKQEFFGISVIEAIYCNVFPLLPRRLTYPELFNDKINHKKTSFMIITVNFLKIKKAILNVENIAKEHIEKYDWNIISNSYDKIFKDLKKDYLAKAPIGSHGFKSTGFLLKSFKISLVKYFLSTTTS